MPIEKAPPTTTNAKVNAAAMTEGWRRSICFIRPNRRPINVTFIGTLFVRDCSCAIEVNYAEKGTPKQGILRILLSPFRDIGRGAMQYPRVVSNLLQVPG